MYAIRSYYDPGISGQASGVDHVFKKCNCLGIRIRNGQASVLLCCFDDICRKKLVMAHFFGFGLRNFPVLAIQTAKVASYNFV